MRYYLIRHKATGEFMPELRGTRGYSHWNPTKVITSEHLGRKKLIGTPRLFANRRTAYRSIIQWNALPNSYTGYKRGPFGDEDYETQIDDDGRKKEDLEIVEVDIIESRISIEAAFKAGYHCRWHKEQGFYCFDPAMSPGDPDGAFAAWYIYLVEPKEPNGQD